LESLVENKPELEYIFIESNGLADPANIIKIFWLDDELISNLDLNYTMGIIDAKNFMKNLDNPETSEALKKQLVYADKILINKMDLVESDLVHESEGQIKGKIVDEVNI
jgi:G3E family GTPase